MLEGVEAEVNVEVMVVDVRMSVVEALCSEDLIPTGRTRRHREVKLGPKRKHSYVTHVERDLDSHLRFVDGGDAPGAGIVTSPPRRAHVPGLRPYLYCHGRECFGISITAGTEGGNL